MLLLREESVETRIKTAVKECVQFAECRKAMKLVNRLSVKKDD